jgi:hypothetical protein
MWFLSKQHGCNTGESLSACETHCVTFEPICDRKIDFSWWRNKIFAKQNGFLKKTL